MLTCAMTGTNLTPNVDVSVTKTDDADPVAAGTNLVYTITVNNAGPDPATGVTLEDWLPPYVLQVEAAFSQGYISVLGTNLTWYVGILGAGASATLDLTVRPMQVGTITNYVSVTVNEIDTSPVNNLAEETTVINPPIDSDGDLMPDWWETIYFGGATNGIAGADDDSDGHSNLLEYYAYTDPTDDRSILRITGFARDPDTRVTFASTPVRLYTLQFRASLLTGDWTNLVTDVTGDDLQTSVTDTNLGTKAIYRIKARIP